MKIQLLCAPRGPLTGTEAAYALLRYLVERTYGVAMPEVAKTGTGKPFFPERPDIHFSLSHTTTHVLAAVSDAPVGVDIETRRPVREGVAARVCTPEELKAFDFFELWVLKESFIKVSGETHVDPKKVCFARDGDRIVTPEADVRAKLFSGVPGCAAAVCAQGGDIPDESQITGLSKIIGSY